MKYFLCDSLLNFLSNGFRGNSRRRQPRCLIFCPIEPMVSQSALFPNSKWHCIHKLVSSLLSISTTAEHSSLSFPSSSSPFFSIDSELLSTPDGGTVSIDWAPSIKTMPADDTPTLVLLHGLTGGSHESYIRALVETMTKDHGYRCVVFNARACANTELTSAQLYCGSWTEDLRIVVKHIRKTLPESKLMSVGFSLGANILMNYMGEEGDQCEFLGAISVGNPFDLMG